MRATKIHCPQCNSLLVVRNRPTGLSDRLLALITAYPFQCQACAYRFRAMQRETRGAEGLTERRRIPRVPVQVPVTFETRDGRGDGILTDISAAGCALNSKRRLAPGLILRLQIPVGTDVTQNVHAQQLASVRAVAGERAGLSFLTPTPEDQHALTHTLTLTLTQFGNKGRSRVASS